MKNQILFFAFSLILLNACGSRVDNQSLLQLEMQNGLPILSFGTVGASAFLPVTGLNFFAGSAHVVHDSRRNRDFLIHLTGGGYLRADGSYQEVYRNTEGVYILPLLTAAAYDSSRDRLMVYSSANIYGEFYSVDQDALLEGRLNTGSIGVMRVANDEKYYPSDALAMCYSASRDKFYSLALDFLGGPAQTSKMYEIDADTSDYFMETKFITLSQSLAVRPGVDLPQLRCIDHQDGKLSVALVINVVDQNTQSITRQLYTIDTDTGIVSNLVY